MNPPTLYGSKVEEDPQEFIDEIYKILLSMGLTTSEKAELATTTQRCGPNLVCPMEEQQVVKEWTNDLGKFSRRIFLTDYFLWISGKLMWWSSSTLDKEV